MSGAKMRVAVNGYDVIGKRAADAVALQDDMELVGVADVASDYRIRVAAERAHAVFASDPAARDEMDAAGIPVAGRWIICSGRSTWSPTAPPRSWRRRTRTATRPRG